MKKTNSIIRNYLMMVILLSVLSYQSNATTHYVTPTGTAAFIVSSETNPMSLQYGLWSLGAGDSLLLNGTFPRTAEIYLATDDIYIGSWGTGAIIEGSSDGNTVGFNLMTIVDPTNVTVEDITFTQNYGNNSRGIYVSGEGDALLIQNCTFTDIGYTSVEASTATSADGAHGIIVVGNEEVSLTNVNIIGNTMHDLITGYSESLTLTGNVVNFLIEGNTLYDITNIGIDVAGHFSWVVDADDGADLGTLNQARNGTIRNNTVTNAISPYATSGGIYCDGCKDVVIEQNVVSGCGAGISLGCEVGGGKTASGVLVKNNVFRDNQESGMFLGSLASEASSQGASSVDDCVVRNNTFYKNAVANSSNNYELFVQNSVNNDIYNNIFYLRDAANGIVAATGSTVTDFIVSYNMFYRESGVQTNLVISSATSTLTNTNFQWGDPGFTTAATDDVFEIGTTSLAVNNGDPATVISSGELDLDGDARIQGTISDIGAQESNVTTVSNLTSLAISDDATNLTMTVLGPGITTAYNVFIDIDNNAATGYSDGIDISGAEFYISAGLIYSYSGTAPAWGWTQTTGAVITDVAGVSREFTISRASLGLTSSGTTINALYQNTVNFVATDVLPTSGMLAYTTVASTSIGVTGVSVSPTTATLTVGDTQQLTATIAPVAATDQTVAWSSDNVSVATVDASGLVSTLSAGLATITVTTTDGSFTASSVMTVTAPSCTASILTPYINEVTPIDFWQQKNVVTKSEGYPNIWLKVESVDAGTVTWTGPLASSYSVINEILYLNALVFADSGDYTATFTNNCGTQSTQVFTVNVTQNCSNSDLTAYYGIEAEAEVQGTTPNPTDGEYLYLSPEVDNGDVSGLWSWVGPNGAISNNGDKNLEFDPIAVSDDGTYTVTYTLGACVETAVFVVSVTPVSSTTVVDDENFDSGWGIWNDGGSDSRRSSADASYANSGSYCIRLRDDTNTSVMTTDNLDLSSYSSLNVSLSYITNSMDNSNEGFLLEVSTDGGSYYWEANEWNLNDEFVNNTRYNEVIPIAGPFSSNTKLRFKSDASGNGDWVYIDDVIIEGISSTGSRSLGDTEVSTEVNEIEELKSESLNLLVYPNPATDVVYVSGAVENQRVMIYNSLGSLVLESTDSQINISALQAGIYFINTDNKRAVRLIKK